MYAFSDVSSLVVLEDVEFNDRRLSLICWKWCQLTSPSWGSSLIGSFKVIHHYALIGLTEPCLQLIWLVDDCKRRWHLSASCYLEIQTPSCFPGRSSLLSFLLFSSSCFEVLNASAFRDFAGMCTIIPLKILTTKTKYMPCDVIFLFHLMVKL